MGGHGLSTGEIADLVEFAEARTWSSFYHSAPAATADALGTGGAWAKTFRGNGPVSALQDHVRVERVSVVDVATFGRVAVRGFEMPEIFAPLFGGVVGKPDWHAYLAYDGPEAMATGALYVMGDVVWLGMGSTAPRAPPRSGPSAAEATGCRPTSATARP